MSNASYTTMKEILEKILTKKKSRDAKEIESFAEFQENFLTWTGD
jgi:hypothetical protein